MSPIAQQDLGDLADLKLPPEELAREAGETAAAQERELGGSEEAVRNAYQRAHDATLATAQRAAEEAVNGAEPESPVPETLTVSGRAPEKRWSGKAPTSTVLTLSCPALEVTQGGFRKGERLTIRCEAVIVSEGVKDKLDKETMAPVEAVQSHVARLLDFELLGE